MLHSSKKATFECDKCSHSFEKVLSSFKLNDKNKSLWCPYCSSNIDLCKDPDCNDCFTKSFASYGGTTKTGKKIVDCWSDQNKIKPRQVRNGTHNKYLFNCDGCEHTIEKSITSIVGKETWCPYCSNPCNANYISTE